MTLSKVSTMLTAGRDGDWYWIADHDLSQRRRGPAVEEVEGTEIVLLG